MAEIKSAICACTSPLFDPQICLSEMYCHQGLQTEAIDAGLSGRRRLAEALGDYEWQRNEETLPIYELNYHLASLDPRSLEMQELLSALPGNQAETNQFFGILAGTVMLTGAPSGYGDWSYCSLCLNRARML